MSSWKFVLHVHTRRSHDSFTDPAKLVEHAVNLGIDVLAVTDHDTWQGSVDVFKHAYRTQAPLRVVIASEVYTDQGDLVGLFLQEDIRERSALDFCDAVHEQGGLVYVPHPFRSHQLDEHLLLKCDLIEVFNARTFQQENEKAVNLARHRGMPSLVGPDAHSLSELPLAINEFPGPLPGDEAAIKRALLHDERIFHTSYGSIWNEWRSQAVKLTRRPSVELGVAVVRGAVRRWMKPESYRLG